MDVEFLSDYSILIIFIIALFIDIVIGEYPKLLHPVVWIGKVSEVTKNFLFSSNKILEFLYGVLLIIFLNALFILPLFYFLKELQKINTIIYIIFSAYLLKSTFAIKELKNVALKMKKLLMEKNLPLARENLKSLVSRDTKELDEKLIIAATCSSVIENTNDGIISPILFYLIGGVPLAFFYKIVNTLDAIIGYRGKYEYLGKASARLDDLLNYLPARITLLLTLFVTFLLRYNYKCGYFTMLRDKSRLESPNASILITFLAGALEVEFEKSGYYKVGRDYNKLSTATISDTIKIFKTINFVFLSIVSIILMFLQL